MAVTIGLHMISKGEAGLLRECLTSIEPVGFNQIVVGITHKESWEKGEVREIVEEFGGEAVDLTWLPKVEIEDYGPCIASFSQARNEVYNRLTTDWAFWIDADDVLDGADLLRQMVEQIDAQGMGALFLPYFYGFDDNGNCITVLTRERAVKRSLGWKWVRRVHEGMMSAGPANFAKTADIIVRHNSPTGRGWPKRNLVLLMMEYEENPNDARTHCYIGHQYYALQQWAEAIPWYERYLQRETRKEERWQALNFLADCYCFTGRYQLAIQRDMEAVSLFPDWADPYFHLAEIYARLSQWDACIWWDKVGRSAKVPDAAIFTNPLDYSYNPALYANTAYYQRGDLDTAMKIVEDALKVAPNATHLQEKLEMYQHIKAVREKGLAAVRLWEGMPDEAVLATPVVSEMLDVPEVKTRVAVAQFRTRSVDSPWAIFFCGRSLEQWGPQSLVEGGIGGSETAVIHMAHLLAKQGWKVDVFNDCGKHAGRYGDVGYWPFDWYDPKMEPDLFVGWRQPGCQLVDYKPQGKVKWLWLHDLHIGPAMTPERASYFDRVMGVSQWHSDYLNLAYPFLENLKPTRNGIDLLRFSQEVERDPHKVVYTSSPDRGLEALLVFWPNIVGAVPDAKLHIFYGWQNLDKFPHMIPFKQRIEALMGMTPNVEWRGRVDQVQLAKEFLSAGVWLYPTEFLEVSCITAMECQAAGVAMLASDCGALSETVGDRGILLEGFPNTKYYQQRFIGHAVSLLQNEEWRQGWAAKGLAHAPTFAWELVAQDWLREWEETIANPEPFPVAQV